MTPSRVKRLGQSKLPIMKKDRTSDPFRVCFVTRIKMVSSLEVCAILAALATLLCVAITTAQTANELRQKYGSPDDKGYYLVRPEIAMSVSFAKDGQACKVLIEPLPQIARKDSLTMGLESEIVSEIIDEIVPISMRGRRGRRITFSGWVTVTEYENVRIRRAMVSKSDSTKGERTIEIVWKKRGCE